MSFHSYPVYKPSGVEWLGEVPEHWEVKRIASLYSEVIEAGNEDLPVLSVSIHYGVSDSELGEEDMDRKVTRSEDRSKYKRVAPGDLVYNMMRAWQGAFGSVVVEGMVSPAYVVARPKTVLPTEWIEYLLRTDLAVSEIKRFSRGITEFRLRLYWHEFKNLRICEPPEQERACILRFLDRETAKIDTLIAEQQRLIELLQEKRQAVISHAVTKGLNPNAPMKDSGVEWLGEVPEHWEIKAVKHLCSLLRDGTHLPPPREATGIPLLSVRNIQGEQFALRDDDSFISEDSYEELCRSFSPRPGDTLLAIVGATMGKTAIVPSDIGKFHIQRSLGIFRTKNEALHPEWLNFVFRSSQFNGLLWRDVAFSAQPGIYLGVLKDVPIPVPSLPEQSEILKTSDRKLQDLDLLVAAAEHAVALHHERRSALISAAVTGQIDVRGLATAEEP